MYVVKTNEYQGYAKKISQELQDEQRPALIPLNYFADFYMYVYYVQIKSN